MAVLRKAHKSNFTVIDNLVFESDLSLNARGLLCTMLACPDERTWSVTALDSDLPKDDRDTIAAAYAELESKGFVKCLRTDGTDKLCVVLGI